MIDSKSVEEIVDDVVTSCGFSLVELKFGGTPSRTVLKIFIHRSEGFGVEDCAKVSRELETVLEEKAVIASEYVIEVSSPGSERVLSGSEQFNIFKGSTVKVEVAGEIDGDETIIGTILDLNDNQVKLEGVDGDEVLISLGAIREARLYMDRNKIFQRGPDEF